MPDSTRKPPTKPAKPYADFPLFPHATRRWAKKIKSKLHYFGPWRDPDAALQLYLDQRDDLHAGRRPRVKGEGLTVRDLVNHYLTAKQRKVDAGEMQRRTWLEYHQTCGYVVEFFGRDRVVEDLASDDFGELRATLAKGTKVKGRKARRRGPEALGNQVQRVRCVFKYAYDAGLIDRPVRCGPEFRRPGKVAWRKARQAKPVRLFDAEEIRGLLDKASPQLKAMIYLGINAGLGNTDCASLTRSALKLKKGVLDFPRPKTAIERRATLWPETVDAIREALKVRPDPKDPADADLVFITKYGQPWVKYREGGNVNSVSLQFGKLLKLVDVARDGVGFYALRHTFETVAGETGDQVAVDRIMGHERNDMASVYREWKRDRREDDRLRKVTDHVRDWLFTEEDPGQEEG